MCRTAFFLAPLIALVFGLLVWPMCVLGYASARVSPGGSGPGLTWARYREIFSDPYYRESLVHSLVLSLAVAAASTLFSLAPAWLLARHEFWGQRLMRLVFSLPMSLSGIMVGFLAVVMLGRVGFVPQLLQKLTGGDWLSGSAYQLTGLVIAYLYFEIPRAVLALEAPLRKLDPQWDMAARSLGASAWQRFSWVTLPLIAPALWSTFTLAFSVSLGSFGVALILSRRFSVLPLELFHQFTAMSNTPLAAAMAVVLAMVALFLHLAGAGLVERRRR